MDTKAVLRNLRTKGISETIKIAKNKNKRLEAERIDKLANCFLALMDEGVAAIDKAENKEERKKISALLKAQEDILTEKQPKAAKEYRKRLKARTIKEQIPAIYAEEAKKPVENKVIFMENGGSPSPTNKKLSEVIKEQGKYKVVYKGLHVRKVSDAEYFHNSLGFIKALGTAKVLFLSTANDFLSYLDIRPETKVIQLWHGVGMFKKVGYSTVDNSHFGKSAKDREEYDQYRNYTYVTVAGEEQIWTFEDAFRISRDTGTYKAIGIARTDVFFDEEYYKEELEKLYEAFPQTRGKKLVLYAPTFRGAVAKAKAPDQLDIRKMAEALSDEYVLLIKHHGLCKEKPPIPEDLENVFAFDMNKNKVLTIEGLLGIADILITDYSSVGFEFAIREKPIIFFAYDLDDYLDQRGMYYDYQEITPGPICKTTDEITDFITNIDERFDLEEVRAFRQKYVGACDGHAIERTIALMEE
ncbi:MAG: CDP-glycerol glycerophosphotransferase family protein [Mogibacterium sp.]|nr:CDP-glycerol glycerophosphotransferase family protein [Mogibacterium sp.]MBR2539203.1 CDP-glycerol glycerophosphotransferase family protein [Mogibacterium sp.]